VRVIGNGDLSAKERPAGQQGGVGVIRPSDSGENVCFQKCLIEQMRITSP
jgi:hypothetical protein